MYIHVQQLLNQFAVLEERPCPHTYHICKIMFHKVFLLLSLSKVLVILLK